MEEIKQAPGRRSGEQVGATGPGYPGQMSGGEQFGMGAEVESGEAGVGHRALEGAKRMGGAARSKAVHVVDSRRHELAEQLEKMASTLEHSGAEAGAGQWLASNASQWVRKAAGILRERSAEEMLEEARSQLRQRPAVLIGACFALGFLAARVVRD